MTDITIRNTSRVPVMVVGVSIAPNRVATFSRAAWKDWISAGERNKLIASTHLTVLKEDGRVEEDRPPPADVTVDELVVALPKMRKPKFAADGFTPEGKPYLPSIRSVLNFPGNLTAEVLDEAWERIMLDEKEAKAWNKFFDKNADAIAQSPATDVDE